MIMWFNPVEGSDVRRNAISANRGFHGNIGLFFVVMEKIGQAPFLWYSEFMRVGVDFERNEVMLSVQTQHKNLTGVIPFAELLALSYADLVERYMRPYAATIARTWGLAQTSDVIENGGDFDAIESSLVDECAQINESPKGYKVALTNILYVTAEVPWSRDDWVRSLRGR